MQLHTGDVSMTLLLRVCILFGMPTRWQTLYGGPHIYYLPHLNESKMPVIRRNSIILCTTKNEKTLPITWHTLYHLELRLTLNASALRLILIWIFSYIAFIIHKKGNLSKINRLSFSKKFFPFGGWLFSFVNSESSTSTLLRKLCSMRTQMQESTAKHLSWGLWVHFQGTHTQSTRFNTHVSSKNYIRTAMWIAMVDVLISEILKWEGQKNVCLRIHSTTGC